MARKKPKYADVSKLKWKYKHWRHPEGNSTMNPSTWRRKYNRDPKNNLAGWMKDSHYTHVLSTSTDVKKETAAFHALAEWAHCMFEWGRDVRLHIENLKAEVNLKGDPGDPPPPPWGK